MTKENSHEQQEDPLGNNSDIRGGEFPSRVRAARGAVGKTQVEMAVALGLSLSAVRDYEVGKSLPGAKALQGYAALGFAPRWLLTGEGPMLEGESIAEGEGRYVVTQVFEPKADDVAFVPYYTDVEASGGPGAIPANEEAREFLAFKRSWIKQELGARMEDLAVIRMTGDSMEPTLRAGDVLLLDRRGAVHQGDGIYVLRRRDRLHVKRLQFMGEKVFITSDNPVWKPEEVSEDTPELGLVGRVVWVGRKL